MRFITPARLACMFVSLVVAFPAKARLGETQEEFERRLFQPSVGKFLPKEKNPDPSKEEELARQQPFHEVRAYFPFGVRERKYWKSAVPNMLSNENGWRVHVFFQEGRSVLEAYQRVGDTLNEFEIRNILTANQGSSEWRKIEPDTLESKASAIGCDYQLADGSLRARVVGNWLIVYSSVLDNYVKEQIRMGEQNRMSQQEERVRTQQQNASGSTSGF
ncbi:MAG: hypothetical protein ABW223_00690 [Rariglobus sp.]